jgi:hypothetical protein
MGKIWGMVAFPATHKIPPSALGLGLAGLIPFVACAVSQWASVPQLSPADGLRAGMFYGAVILSFLGGIRWGTAIPSSNSKSQNLDFGLSVLSSLAGWVSLLVSPLLGLSLLIAAFLLQSLWDVLSVERGMLPHWFGTLRMVLTVGAVLSLSAMLVRMVAS